MDKSEKLNKLLELLKTDTITPKEIEQFLTMVVGVIKDSKEKFETISAKTLAEVQDALEYIENEHESMSESVKEMLKDQSGEFKTKLEEVNSIIATIKQMENGKDGKDGVDGLNGVDGKDGLNGSPDTGEDIVEKINQLSTDEKYQIDASHIKNLPEATGGRLGSTARNLWQLNDVTLTDVANDEVLKYNSTTKQWVNGTGGTGSPGGSSTQLQYNNSGAFAGISGATTNGTSVTFTTGNLLVTDVKASATGGVQVLSDTGSVVALFGAASGTSATFYGSVNLDTMTAGSILFAGASGLISQDNASLFFDNTNNRIGFLTTAPTHTVTLASTSTGFAIYNTADQTTNYERLLMQWTGNVFVIQPGVGGTGTNRQLRVGNTYYFQNDVGATTGNAKMSLFGSGNSSANFLDITGMTFTGSSGTQLFVNQTGTVNQTSTAGYTAYKMNITETATGSGTKLLLDLQVGGNSKLRVDNTGTWLMTENTSMQLDPALSADGTYNGITRTGTAGTTLAFGDLCYLDPTDSRWELADANSALAADGDARGTLAMCVQAAAGDGSATTLLLYGTIRADTAFPTMTINSQMYVSETAGDITGTQPSTSGVVIRVVGMALTADELLFNPSPDYITHV